MTASLLLTISRGDEIAPKRLTRRRPCEEDDDECNVQTAPPSPPKRFSPTPQKCVVSKTKNHAWFVIERGTSATFYVFNGSASSSSLVSSNSESQQYHNHPPHQHRR